MSLEFDIRKEIKNMALDLSRGYLVIPEQNSKKLKSLSIHALHRKIENYIFYSTQSFLLKGGWTYFRITMYGGDVKIGMTTHISPWGRVSKSHYNRPLLLAIRTNKPIAEERRWQGMFWNKWISGEKYCLTIPDIQHIFDIGKKENRLMISMVSP